MNNDKLVVGLTGGIGCGKSEAAKCFAQLGVVVADADELAHQLVAPDGAAYQIMIDKLGRSIVNEEDKTIDRSKVRDLIFSEPSLKGWLEELLHPLIRKKMQQLIEEQDSPYYVLVIPLLLENLPQPLVSHILVIDTDQETQYQRVRQRDHLSREKIKIIIDYQASREQRQQQAGDLIDNSGDLRELAEKVKQLHQKYLKIASSK